MTDTKLDPNLTDARIDADLELARQLLGLRQEPGPELRRAVRAIPRQPRPRSRWLPAVNWGLAGLIALVLLFVSPAAQATVGIVEILVGRIHLVVAEILPRPQTPVVVKSRTISLAEARAMAPFDLMLPGYLPPSLDALNPEISVIELEQPIIKILWRDLEGGFVQLTIHALTAPERTRLQTLIGPQSSETISINGQTAVLVNGAWDESGQTWDRRDQLKTLIWETRADHIQYKLLAFSDLVTPTDLIAIAESIRPPNPEINQ